MHLQYIPLCLIKFLARLVCNLVQHSTFSYAFDFHLIPLLLVHYRMYNDKGTIVTKRPAYLTDNYLGHVRPKWVAPLHDTGSLRRCLAWMESIDQTATTLLATLSSKSALADDIPVSFETNQTLGIMPDDPVALLTMATPGDGLWPGTENLHVPPDARSPLIPCFRESMQSDFILYSFTQAYILSSVLWGLKRECCIRF